MTLLLEEEVEIPFTFDYRKVAEELILGDIVISVEHVMAQAKEYGHSFKREYAFLIAHSMLHLMGYDHMSPEEASIMEERQSYILDLLHITREEEKNV